MNFYKHHLGDYAKDTAHLSILEHGVYLLLLHHHYATEAPLPTDQAVICRIIRATNKAEIAAVAEILRQFWTLTPAGWVNGRATEEIERAASQRDTNRELGRRGGRPRKTESVSESETESVFKTKPNGKPNRNPSQTPDSRHQEKGDTPPTPPPPDGGDEPKHPSPPDGLFAEFWAAYPRKVGKEAARKAWRRVTRPAETLQAIQAALQWQCQSEQWSRHNGQFIPHPATYLSEQRWLDEPPRAQVVTLTQTGQRAVSAAQRWLETQEASA